MHIDSCCYGRRYGRFKIINNLGFSFCVGNLTDFLACTGQPKLIIILFCDLENIVRLVLETGERGGGGGGVRVGARGLQKQIERQRDRETEKQRDRERQRVCAWKKNKRWYCF